MHSVAGKSQLITVMEPIKQIIFQLHDYASATKVKNYIISHFKQRFW